MAIQSNYSNFQTKQDTDLINYDSINQINTLNNSNKSKNLVDYGRLVYIKDQINGYILGKLLDIGTDTITVQLFDQLKTIVWIIYFK